MRHKGALQTLGAVVLLTGPALAVDCPDAVEMLARDMGLPHAALPSGVPDTYDWARTPRLGYGNHPGEFTAFIAWGQVYAVAGAPLAANTRVELGPIRALILSPATGRWSEMHPSVVVQGDAYREDFEADVSVAADTRVEPDGNLSARLVAGHNYHFWPETGRVLLGPAGVGGVVVTMQARLIPDDPIAPDDRADARLMLSVGADYWQALDAAWPNNGDAAIGRFGFITQDWQTFTMTTLPEAALCANPPPL